MNAVSRDEAIQALQQKNETIKTLFDQIEIRVEEYEIPKIMRHIQRLTQIQSILEAKLIESHRLGIEIDLPSL